MIGTSEFPVSAIAAFREAPCERGSQSPPQIEGLAGSSRSETAPPYIRKPSARIIVYNLRSALCGHQRFCLVFLGLAEKPKFPFGTAAHWLGGAGCLAGYVRMEKDPGSIGAAGIGSQPGPEKQSGRPANGSICPDDFEIAARVSRFDRFL